MASTSCGCDGNTNERQGIQTAEKSLARGVSEKERNEKGCFFGSLNQLQITLPISKMQSTQHNANDKLGKQEFDKHRKTKHVRSHPIFLFYMNIQHNIIHLYMENALFSKFQVAITHSPSILTFDLSTVAC